MNEASEKSSFDLIGQSAASPSKISCVYPSKGLFWNPLDTILIGRFSVKSC